MEKIICRLCYWLGIASLVITLLWRGLNAVGIGAMVVTPGVTVSYMSFYKASLLLLVAAIATANCAWLNSQKP